MAQAPTTPAPAPKPVVKKTGLLQYFREVRSEVRKVTWASRNETLISTVFVFIMVIFASLFFFLSDAVLKVAIGFILGIGGGQ
jgi:preprotein translocase subunit SecE